MKIIKRLFFVVTVICALSIATIASSVTLDCILTDLDDSLGPGGDLWQATYPLTYDGVTSLNYLFTMFDDRYDFAIIFDKDLYQSIEWVDTPVNSPYLYVSITQPFLNLDGYIRFHFFSDVFSYNIFPFSIQFVWLGDGDPDGQSWMIYEWHFDSPLWAYPSSYGEVNITEINRLPEPEPTPLPSAFPAILMLLLK